MPAAEKEDEYIFNMRDLSNKLFQSVDFPTIHTERERDFLATKTKRKHSYQFILLAILSTALLASLLKTNDIAIV